MVIISTIAVFQRWIWDTKTSKMEFIGLLHHNPARIYLVRVNNGKTRTWSELCSKLTIKTLERLDDVVLVLLTSKIFYILFYSILLLILNKEIPTGKEVHFRCCTDHKDTTLVFDRLFGTSQSAHLFYRNALVFRTQVMTLHCEAKTKKIDLFLYKDPLFSEAATESYSKEICNVLTFVVQTLEQYFWRISLTSLR